MKNYLTAEEFDLMNDLELDAYYDDEFHFLAWKKEDRTIQDAIMEKEAMETDYQYCK